MSFVQHHDRSPAPRARASRGASLICVLSLGLALPPPLARAQGASATPTPAAPAEAPAPAAPAAVAKTPAKPPATSKAAAKPTGKPAASATGSTPAAAGAPTAAGAATGSTPSAPGAVTGSSPAPSSAAPAGDAAPPPLAESLSGSARDDYAAARILYEDGDYAGAYTKLEAAFSASKDPRLLWNMAACEKEQRHYAKMIDLLERYLSEGGSLIGQDERQATHDLVATVEQFVNELRLEVEPEGASIFIDGAAAGTAPLSKPVRVDMGKRLLRVEKDGYVPYATELELGGGKSIDVKVTLEAEVHEGILRIVADPDAVISVDGHVVGTASWFGTLPSGTHSVHVSANGKQPYQTEVVIKDGDTSALHIALQNEQKNVLLRDKDSSNSTLWWVLGGVALAGAGVGGYFLLRPNDDPKLPDSGTWGQFELNQ